MLRICCFLLMSQWALAQEYNFPLFGFTFNPPADLNYNMENGDATLGNPYNYNEIQCNTVFYADDRDVVFEMGLVLGEDFNFKNVKHMQAPGKAKSSDFQLKAALANRLLLSMKEDWDGNWLYTYYFLLPSKAILYLEAYGPKGQQATLLAGLQKTLKGLSITQPATFDTSPKDMVCKGPLSGKVQSHLLPVSELIQFYSNGPWMAINNNNELMIAQFTIQKGYVVTAYDINTKKQIWKHTHSDLEVSAFCAAEDGYAFLTTKSGEWEKEEQLYIYLAQFDRNQKKILEKRLTREGSIEKEGDQIYTETSRGCGDLDYKNGRFIAQYATLKRHDDGVDHQGDRIDIIKKDGSQETWAGWHVSHSFQQRIFVENDYFTALSLGDAYPRGINFSRSYFKEEDKEVDHSIFDLRGESGDNYVADTRIGEQVELDDHSYICFDTEEGVKGKSSEFYFDQYYNDLMLSKVDASGEVVFTKNLSNTYNLDEGLAKMVVYGDQLLLVYNQATYPQADPDEYTFNEVKNSWQYLLVDKNGNKVAGPHKLTNRFDQLAAQPLDFWLHLPTPPATEGTRLLAAPNGKYYLARFLLNRPYVELLEISK